MKLLTALFAFVLVVSAGVAQAQPALAITGATIIDVREGSRIADSVVLTRGGVISAIGTIRSLQIPQGARIVDARGKFLIPGLWDVHTHIQNQRELDVFFPLLIAHGIVGIRDAGGLLPREFEELGKQHKFVPHVVAAGTPVDGATPDGASDAAIVDELADKGVDYIKIFSMIPHDRFLAIMARAKQRGLHVAGHVPVAVSVAEASDAGMRTIEHLSEVLLSISSQETAIRTAKLESLRGANAAIDQALIIHFPSIEPYLATWSDKKASALFAKLVANRTWQTPTLELYHAWGAALDDPAFWSDPNLALIPKDWIESWLPHGSQFLREIPESELPDVILRIKAWYRAQLEVTRRMHAAGVSFLAGTDSSRWDFLVPGLSLHEELQRFVDAGLTPSEALQTATINPAKYLGMDRETGTIDVGKHADLLLLDADPTANIANTRRISAVVLGGSIIERKELDGMLTAARQHAADVPGN
jgi:imidazolonepropionase-like amidohydrolase